jgi:[acyl-carrier-protein] S-malonyltransferase
MGKDFYEASAAARELFDRANQIVGFDLRETTFHGPEDRVSQTDVSQPAIYATSIACFAAAKEAGVVNPEEVTAFAGLSLGEYTALHLGGAFSFEDGLKLVAARGKYMQEAATATPSGMVAIMGADEATINDLCAKSAEGEVLVPANFNAPGQIVVSGSKAACERVQKAADGAGFKSVPLVVAGAFHSPIMQSGADKMREELEKVKIEKPRTTVYSNVTAQPHSDPATIKKLLVDQIVKPVRWEQTMQTLVAQGDARWIELAPDRKLTGMLKKINRRLPVESFATVEALKSTNQSTRSAVGLRSEP